MSSPWLFPSVSVMLIPFAMLLSSCCTSVHGGNVLLYPLAFGMNSHLMDMIKFAQMLTPRGHNVTFLINRPTRHLVESLNTTIIDYAAPDKVVNYQDVDYVREQFMNSRGDVAFARFLTNMVEEHCSYCEEILKDEHVMLLLKNHSFDLLITDYTDNCGRILTNYLDIATIVYSPVGLTIGPIFFPNLPSIVPSPLSMLPSPMNLIHRLENTLRNWLGAILTKPVWYQPFEDLRSRYGLESSLPLEAAYTDKLALVLCSFSLDYPRPLSPNVVCIGGWHIEEPKPLSRNLEVFVQGAGDDGVVLLSFGSLVAALDRQRSEMIARVLSRLPQRVIWRFEGEVPVALGNNTLLQRWIPQNDLLAHPNIRSFITHCGAHGTFEAIHHAVPVLAIPLFADQHEHAGKLTNRLKMGRYVDMITVTEEEFEEALRDVINNQTYKLNAQHASVLLRDQPISMRDTFIYYAEYTMRHQGVQHLSIEPLRMFGAVELYSIDIGFILCTVTLAILIVIGFVLRFCLRAALRGLRSFSKTKVA